MQVLPLELAVNHTSIVNLLKMAVSCEEKFIVLYLNLWILFPDITCSALAISFHSILNVLLYRTRFC